MLRPRTTSFPLRRLLLPAIAAVLAPPLAAQPANDACTSPIQLLDGLNAGFTTVGATVTTGLTFVCSNGPNPDVWFEYTATCNGSVTFSLCAAAGGTASYNAALSVYGGSCLPPPATGLVLLDCNDDACGNLPQVTADCVSAGTLLILRVAGLQGDTGTFDVVVTCNPPPPPPPNDECTGALPLIDGTNALSSTGATATAGPAFTCGPAGADVWFSYTATCTGVATFSLCPPAVTDFDAILSVYTGTCGALVAAGCSDDVCGEDPRVSVATSAGTSYFVRVGGAGSCALTGAFDLVVSCAVPPPNDDCATATPVVNGLNLALDNTNATDGAVVASCGVNGTPGHGDVWFSYVASCTGVVTAATCDVTGAPTLGDTLLAVYEACGGSELACNDNAQTVCVPRSSLSFSATAGTTYRLRVASPSPTASGTFNLTITCAPDAAAVDDFGDAPGGAPLAQHTNAGQERLGTGVSAEANPRTPAWFGDSFDDGLVSVSNLFPSGVNAQVVVRAETPAGAQTDFCRIWVRRTGLSLGWSPFGDGLPSQTSVVGAAPVFFTFGPFTHNAVGAPSPAIRIRLSRDAAGVTNPTMVGAFGEVEDYVAAGSGGTNLTPLAGSSVSDAGDAPLPYPPAGIRSTADERLGAVTDGDGNSPAGFPVGGTTAWDDDGSDDDGIVRLEGMRPGSSVVLRALASNPVASTFDAVRAWFDWNGDGDWDDPGEATPEEIGLVTQGLTGTVFTLGPLAVPAGSVDPVPTRLKLSRLVASGGLVEGGQLAAGASSSYGEIEDYLLPLQQGTGCNTATGIAATSWTEDPPRVGFPFTWRLGNLVPGGPVFFDADISVLPGIDLFLLGAPAPPGACFLYVPPGNVFSFVGLADFFGNFSLTVPIPPVPALAGGVVYTQGFQLAAGPSVAASNYLALTILPD